jgi:hypothetical protein
MEFFLQKKSEKLSPQMTRHDVRFRNFLKSTSKRSILEIAIDFNTTHLISKYNGQKLRHVIEKFTNIEDYTYVSRRTLTSETRLGPVLIGQYTRINVYRPMKFT